MEATISTLMTTFIAGMTTGHSSDDYYVKEWYTDDPLQLANPALPAAALLSTSEGAKGQYVGEDTVIEVVTLRLLQAAVRALGESTAKAAGMTKLRAMVDRARLVTRTDPTFGVAFINCEFGNANFNVPQAPDANVMRVADVPLTVYYRKLWGQ